MSIGRRLAPLVAGLSLLSSACADLDGGGEIKQQTFDQPVQIDVASIKYQRPRENLPIRVRVAGGNRVHTMVSRFRGNYYNVDQIYRLKLDEGLRLALPLVLARYVDVRMDSAAPLPTIEAEIVEFAGDIDHTFDPGVFAASTGRYSYRLRATLRFRLFDSSDRIIAETQTTNEQSDSFGYVGTSSDLIRERGQKPEKLLADTVGDLLAKFFADQTVVGALTGQTDATARVQAGARAPAAQTAGRFPTSPPAIRFPRAVERADDVAVIIGNADYGRQARDIPDVVPAYADAEGFRRYAIEALGVREGNIIFLKDASQAQMISVFGSPSDEKGQLYNWTRPGASNVVVYFSGHGAPGGRDGSSYLVPVDANGATIELNGYPLEVLYRNLGKLPAKSVTVVLEACFSGASQGGAVISNASPVFQRAKTTAVPTTVTVIAAGAENQMASWEQDKSQGLFTKYFLLGMSGEADRAPYGNGDGVVGLAELDAYLRQTLTYYARRYYGRDQSAQIVNAGARR